MEKQDDKAQAMREMTALSALLDAEAGPDEARQAHALLAENEAVRRRWRHYQLTGSAMRRDAVSDVESADEAFVSSVMQRIQQERQSSHTEVDEGYSSNVVQLHARQAETADQVDIDSPSNTKTAAHSRHWLPMSMAAAASAVVVAGTLWLVAPLQQNNEAAWQEAAAEQPAKSTTLVSKSIEERVYPAPKPAQRVTGKVQVAQATVQTRTVNNAQLNAYLLTHNNQASTNLGGALGLVRVAAHTQSNRR